MLVNKTIQTPAERTVYHWVGSLSCLSLAWNPARGISRSGQCNVIFEDRWVRGTNRSLLYVPPSRRLIPDSGLLDSRSIVAATVLQFWCLERQQCLILGTA